MITEVEPYIFISSKIDQKHIDEMIYLIKECDGAEYYLKDVNKIHKTDWNMPKTMNRPYWQYFAENCLDNFAADFLDQFQIGGFKLGFWFAQQGSIYFFVLLIFIYIYLMNKLDKKYEDKSGKDN